MKKIIVIGAGASGMLAAITAARQGASVTILEGMEKPGKKLLITGSGRCNLTNLRQEITCYRGADSAFISGILRQLPVKDTLAFFRELGLLTVSRDGYVYPVTGQASSVLEVLLLEIRRLGIKLKCTEKVTAIRREDKLLVKTAGWTYEADAVILAAGSKAAPATGSDGSGYSLAKSCGHSLVTPREALVPLAIRESWVKKLSGLRMQASVTLEGHTETGELQWTDTGISGIVVFQLSRYAVCALAKQQEKQISGVPVQLDLLPSVSGEALLSHLQQLQALRDGRSAESLLAGVLAKKAAGPLLQAAGISPSEKAERLDGGALQRLVKVMKQLTLTVSGCRSFEQAQVCQGGVRHTEVDAQTLESKKMPGLYITGELLDVDGICGGYNLQWAWASGFAAGRAAGSQEKMAATKAAGSQEKMAAAKATDRPEREQCCKAADHPERERCCKMADRPADNASERAERSTL
ncbi:flavoprotein family protein [Marvinbryantia formatexigens DSM 14469]|uniref:Flavoprotein family protein n=1 Tax=Marvinbryantia formatexigens DSM 14469 TaxID=478749 RepID=C6LCC1_9FIRM|nr:NAD(P)/FAD-dependent oxidoreductase [Marvinbryantia formatexigens]EET61585.1 flavoprotein family protein [Marvinbryantia formatexigens DSM 14469]UWO24584.1 NAD(P)/FAD-dependent oxidoreductase [Marvinbryantia formatexigens DSM 14469]SDF14384.1 hypothetical protein SAMN05660368_00183 [Marvinbryantia formatexigens]